MMNCKGKPTPEAVAFITSFVSAVYIPVATIGNLLVILAILVDPLKELRTRLNMWLINIAVAGTIIGGVVNPYRAYGNYLKGIGENLNEVIGPTRPFLSHSCHVNLFGSQLMALFVLKAALMEQLINVQLRPKTSMMVFGIVTLILFGVCYGCGSLTVVYGFDSVEWGIYSVTCVGSAFGMFVSYFAVYKQLQSSYRDTASRPCSTSKQTDRHVTIKEEHLVEEIELEDVNVPSLDQHQDHAIKLQNAKSLVAAFVFLFVCTAPCCVMVFVTGLEAVPSCVEYFWLKDLRILFVVSIVAWIPYLFIFTIPNLKRGVVALLRKRSPAVGAISE